MTQAGLNTWRGVPLNCQIKIRFRVGAGATDPLTPPIMSILLVMSCGRLKVTLH
jgi:hypothetical protein